MKLAPSLAFCMMVVVVTECSRCHVVEKCI